MSQDGEEEIIEITSPVTVGQDIRPVGCDIKKDETILYHLSELGPIELGLLATVGVNNIEVYKQPTVAVLSTGDEVTYTDSLISFSDMLFLSSIHVLR